MGRVGYVPIRSYSDLASAEAIAAMLRSENIKAVVDPSDNISAPLASQTTGFRVLVAEEHVKRAKWILESDDVSDRELDFMATGEFTTQDEE